MSKKEIKDVNAVIKENQILMQQIRENREKFWKEQAVKQQKGK